MSRVGLTSRGALLSAGLLVALCSGCSGLQYKEDDELWAESDRHFEQGRYDEALPYYDELADRHEDDGRVLVMRGQAHEHSGQESAALDDYEQAADHGEVGALLFRADLNLRLGDLPAAEEDLTQLRNAQLRGRDRVIHLTLLGTLRLKQGKARLAAQSLERAVEAGRGSGDAGLRRHVGDAHYNASEAYYQLGDFGRAYDHFLAYVGGAGGVPLDESELLERQVPSVSGRDYYMLGLLAYLAGDFDAADVHLSRADPELVAKAAAVLDDPSFGASQGGLK